MMTRKDFEAIARIIRFNRCAPRDGMKAVLLAEPKGLIDDMADYLLSQNARFDHERFIVACK